MVEIIRPAEDFVADEDLQKMVHCEQCNEPLIKMFRNDHKCDEKKFNQMVKNERGHFADPLAAFKERVKQ